MKKVYVYLLVQRSDVLNPRYFRVLGVFDSKEAADKKRQEFWDQGYRPQADVETYFLQSEPPTTGGL